MESEYNLQASWDRAIEVITWSCAAAARGGRRTREAIWLQNDQIFSLSSWAVQSSAFRRRKRTDVRDLCSLYIQTCCYDAHFLTSIGLMKGLEKHQWKLERIVSSVGPDEEPAVQQSWVAPIFSLDLLLIAAADSDGLRLWPTDGLPTQLLGGSITEDKLFDFCLGWDQVTLCWPLGWQRIHMKSGWYWMSDSETQRETQNFLHDSSILVW